MVKEFLLFLFLKSLYFCYLFIGILFFLFSSIFVVLVNYFNGVLSVMGGYWKFLNMGMCFVIWEVIFMVSSMVFVSKYFKIRVI